MASPLPTKERTRLFLYHKPPGLMTTEKDPEGRATVFAALPEGLPRVVSVGRLDLNTEGLLLLTNDGGLARVLAHPKTGWLRRYRVRAFGEITQDQLDGLKHGIEIDGMHYGPVEAKVDREQGSNMWLTLGLREGKNREVKRILEHFGLKVNRLIRISFGPFQLGELAQGAVEEVRTRILKDQLGPELAREAKLDFADEAANAPPRDGTRRRESTRPEERAEREQRRARAPHGEEAHQRRGWRPDVAGREPRDRERSFGKRDPASSDRPAFGRPPRRGATPMRRAPCARRKRSRRAGEARPIAIAGATRRAGRREANEKAARKRERRNGLIDHSMPESRQHRMNAAICVAAGSQIERAVASSSNGSPRTRRPRRTTRQAAKRGEARDGASPPRDTDVLRRKTRREQGPGPPRDKLRAGGPTGKSRTDAWKARGGDRPASRFDHRPGDERPSRHGGENRQNREADRPWRREKTEGGKARGEGFKPRHEGFKRDKRPDPAKPRQDRAERHDRVRERPEGSPAHRERVEEFQAAPRAPGRLQAASRARARFRAARLRAASHAPRALSASDASPRPAAAQAASLTRFW